MSPIFLVLTSQVDEYVYKKQDPPSSCTSLLTISS
jgi:hypothetical protein